MKSYEEDAELLIETANQRPEKLLTSGSSCSKWKILHQKILDLYVEENRRDLHNKPLRCSSSILGKLVQREQLNTLVVNLYKGNEGFSLMLKGREGDTFETIKLSYDENELLEHINNEELPAILVDLLDRVQTNLFYGGCVICEVRDYRRTVSNKYDSKYVLLKPTQQSLQCDINTLSSDGHMWTQEDLYSLESQLLLATSPPLCLDPSPTVALISNKLHNDKHKLCTQPIKRAVKKYTQSAVNRKRKMAHCSAPSYLRLHDFVTKRRDKLKGSPAVNLRVGKSCVDMWRQRDVPLSTPEQIDVLKYAKQMEKTKLTMDNTPRVVEEFTFESERGQGKVNFSKLTILKRVSDEFYLGELYVDRDFQQGQPKGSTCKFPLGTKSNVEKYIKQFREIFTEEGRRQVKITHQMSGQNPSVSFTQATATMTSNGGGTQSSTTSTSSTTSAQAMLSQAANLAATLTGQIQAQAACIDPKKRPVKLSLTIGNTTSTASSGNGTQINSSAINNPGSVAATQLSLAQQQQIAASQRLRQVGIMTNVNNRPSSAPNTPSQIVSTPTANLTIPGYTSTTVTSSGITIQQAQQSQQLQPPQSQQITSSPSRQQLSIPSAATLQLTPTHNQQQLLQHQQQTPPHQQSPYTAKLLGASQSATPPPNVTITMAGTIPIARRPTTLDGIVKSRGGGGGQCNSAPPSAPATPTTSADPSGTANQILAAVSTSGTTFNTLQPQQQQPQQQQQINNSSTSTSSIPQNINIQNITGLQGVNIANLSGLQNIQVSVSGMPGGIAVPLGLSNLNVINAGSANQPNVVFSPAASQAVTTSTVTAGTNVQQVVSQTSNVAPTTRLSGTSQNNPYSTNTALQGANTGGMLSVPIGVAGNITQFMTAAGLKGAQGIRPGTPLLLSQVPGQQPFQLLSTSGFPQNTRLQLNPSPQQPSTPAKTITQSTNAGPVSGGVGNSPQQFLQLAPQSSMTHLTIQGGAAVLTPSRATKVKKLPGNTPPNS